MFPSLIDFLIRSHDGGIYTLARFITRHVTAQWQRVLEENFAHLSSSSGLADDTLYCLYVKLLFDPVNQALERAGFAANPVLPGSFARSREWGPEHERQRWLWSKITSPRGEAVGSLLVIFYHDHTQLRIPRAPLILPLQEPGIEDALKSDVEASAPIDDEELLVQG
jgi:hypothetical protein